MSQARKFIPDPIRNQYADIRFRLIPQESQLCFRFLSNSFCTPSIQWADTVPYFDDESQDALSFPHLEAETSSSLTLDLIHEWYFSCRASHPRCSYLVDGKSLY